MQTYKVEVTRRVVTQDVYRTEIEADSPEEANSKAAALAWNMNGDCPDDIEKTDWFDCESWEVGAVIRAEWGDAVKEAAQTG